MDVKKIIEEALEARKNSYSPYSKFPVGAAILLKNGEYIHGANIENASYPLTMCAERNAIFQAYARGYRADDIEALAIVADTPDICSPCGACRQVIDELLNSDTPIILANLHDKYIVVHKEDLLPFSFKPSDLS